MTARRLPSLTALRMFEAAARHMSFSRAAEDLGVTHSAVSRQIRELELFIGRALFHRSTRRVSLTPIGARYASVLHRAFDDIAAATLEAQKRDPTAPLVISTMDSFAMKWLIPRLPRFQAQHPDIGVRVHTSDDPVDFRQSEIDLAIRYGQGDYPQCISSLLMKEEVIAICSPERLKSGPPLRSPDDLKHHRLLHHEMHDWQQWLQHANAEHVSVGRGVTTAHSLLVIEAAIRGDGVALARRALVENDLLAGNLVDPFGISLPQKFAYFIVFPKGAAQDKRIRAFSDWLKQEVETSRWISTRDPTGLEAAPTNASFTPE